MNVARHASVLAFSLVALACSATSQPTAATPGASSPLPEPQVAAEATSTEEEQLVATALSDAACQDTDLCRLSGYCTAEGDQCVVASDADCRSSEQCKTDGACSAGDDECVAATNADCKSSHVCLREARCTAQDGYCDHSS